MASTSSSRVTPFSIARPRWKAELLGAVLGDERGDGDEAAIALGQLAALPDVAEEDLGVELGELRGEGERVLGHA